MVDHTITSAGAAFRDGSLTAVALVDELLIRTTMVEAPGSCLSDARYRRIAGRCGRGGSGIGRRGGSGSATRHPDRPEGQYDDPRDRNDGRFANPGGLCPAVRWDRRRPPESGWGTHHRKDQSR